MNQPDLFNEGTGEERRTEALAATKLANYQWNRRATAALRSLPLGTDFSSDSLRALLGDDEPKHPNCWGATIRGFYEAGNARVVGYRKSKRPEAKARRILVYRRIQKESKPPTSTE